MPTIVVDGASRPGARLDVDAILRSRSCRLRDGATVAAGQSVTKAVRPAARMSSQF